jgi:hypothetical protein
LDDRDCFSALNLFPEAEKEITAGYQSITAALGPTHPRAKTAAKSATAMYARWGKPDEAATWEAKAAPSK